MIVRKFNPIHNTMYEEHLLINFWLFLLVSKFSRVVASTPEWVTEFCGDNLEHNDKDLRAVGIKLV